MSCLVYSLHFKNLSPLICRKNGLIGDIFGWNFSIEQKKNGNLTLNFHPRSRTTPVLSIPDKLNLPTD